MLLEQAVQEFIRLFETGRGLEALEKFCAPDMVMFENRELTRAGREQCLEQEREALSRLSGPPSMKALRYAVDESSGTAFIEWLIRVQPADGDVHRLEEVAVQVWENELLVSERHYYQGFVDEGDEVSETELSL